MVIATEGILLLAVCGVVSAAEPVFVGRVVSFHDGDTVRMLDATNVQHDGRLNGINAPERGQPLGTSPATVWPPLKVPHGPPRAAYGQTLCPRRPGSGGPRLRIGLTAKPGG